MNSRVRVFRYYSAASGNFLGILPAPRGEEGLAEDLQCLKKQGVQLLVCLMESDEARAAGLAGEDDLCREYGIEFIHFPIPDYGVPASRQSAGRLAVSLAEKLKENKSIAIHCRGGIGRSSLIAALVMLHCGWKLQAILPHMQQIRGFDVPETEAQKKWLQDYEGAL